MRTFPTTPDTLDSLSWKQFQKFRIQEEEAAMLRLEHNLEQVQFGSIQVVYLCIYFLACSANLLYQDDVIHAFLKYWGLVWYFGGRREKCSERSLR